jgi:hypothetical protein
MSSRPTSSRLLAASAALLLALGAKVIAQDAATPGSPAPSPMSKEAPQDSKPQEKMSGQKTPGDEATGDKVAEGKSDKKGMLPAGTPVFWRDPGDVSARDLKAGPGGEEMRPDLSRLTFIEEETGGYSIKFRVRDGAGKVWVAKLGKEAQPETAASRIVWAVGYPTEITYLAPCVVIEGAPAPRHEVARCAEGGFANVRFEARPENVKRLDEWKWKENPFAGTREMNGFVVIMALINNWDLKDSNNKVIHDPETGELRYVVSDLGATFGKTGNFITHNRNSPKDYAKSRFVEKVEKGRVVFSYDGKNTGLLSNIPVEDAKWVGELLARLSDRQLKDAFLAANYAPEVADALAASVRARINELTRLDAAPPRRAGQ